MTDDRPPAHGHPRSTAQIGGHPIHPMLIPFPIVCFIGGFVADVMFALNGSPGWATASNWLIGVGLGMAVLAALAGITDFLGDQHVRGMATAVKHMLANVTAVVLEAVNLALRVNNQEFITAAGIYISGVVVLILVYSGWLGGEMVFRHGVGVRDRDHVM